MSSNTDDDGETLSDLLQSFAHSCRTMKMDEDPAWRRRVALGLQREWVVDLYPRLPACERTAAVSICVNLVARDMALGLAPLQQAVSALEIWYEGYCAGRAAASVMPAIIAAMRGEGS